MKPGNELTVAGLFPSAGCVSHGVNWRTTRSLELRRLTCYLGRHPGPIVRPLQLDYQP
jgi:hypothetical protein